MGNEKNGSSPRTDLAGEPHMLRYEIRVKGCLDEVFWTEWFGDMVFSIDPDLEETLLCGPIADQAELYGLFSRLRNKGLTLISVLQIPQES